MTSFETFLQLHQQVNPLLLGNVWDVTSAKTFERNGYKAIATSSRAVAHSMGYEDGENIPFELLLQTVKRIVAHINIPLSVDMEGGYCRTITGIIENIDRLYDLGIVGINIEDAVVHGNGELQAADDFQKILSSITNHLARGNKNLFVNARTDSFLVKHSSPLAETIKRAKAYANAGASGIFVPFIFAQNDIRQVVDATTLPVNVLCMPQLPGFKELSLLGVKRISMGNAPFDFLLRSLEKEMQLIRESQSFKSLFE